MSNDWESIAFNDDWKIGFTVTDSEKGPITKTNIGPEECVELELVELEIDLGWPNCGKSD